jgi:hypothetical protein
LEVGITGHNFGRGPSKLKPLNQIKPNLAGMVPGWVPFKIVSDSPALHSRWPLLLKIEISSNGQNYSILSQSSNGQLKFHPPFFLFLAWRPSWLEVGINGHNFGRGPFKNMAAVTKNRNFFKWPKLLYFKPESAQI